MLLKHFNVYNLVEKYMLIICAEYEIIISKEQVKDMLYAVTNIIVLYKSF